MFSASEMLFIEPISCWVQARTFSWNQNSDTGRVSVPNGQWQLTCDKDVVCILQPRCLPVSVPILGPTEISGVNFGVWITRSHHRFDGMSVLECFWNHSSSSVVSRWDAYAFINKQLTLLVRLNFHHAPGLWLGSFCVPAPTVCSALSKKSALALHAPALLW